jgi:hypothetical protein
MGKRLKAGRLSMKRILIRIISLGLTLMLCMGAAAETTDDLTYTMAEKLMKQLYWGSGFAGTLTLSATAVEGREADAFSTIKPMDIEWTYIKTRGNKTTPDEMRLILTADTGDYQQGSAEISVQDGSVYMRSSLLNDGWYLLGNETLDPVLQAFGLSDTVTAASDLTRAGGIMPGTTSFFLDMAAYLIGGNTDGISESLEQYTTKIDFWLEGYRDSFQTDCLEDGTSVMKIEYNIPAAAVKAQMKQLLIDLMNDEALLGSLQALIPEEQAALFLEPSLQPYYFFAVDELPLEDDMTIHRVQSFLGETLELSVAMPLYDSEAGAMTLLYTRTQGGDDMLDENTLSLTGEGSYVGLSYHTYETITGATVYQGTIRVESPEADGIKPKTLLASFDLSTKSVTTKDLNGYETLNQILTLSVAPQKIPDTEDASHYVAFSQTDLALDMSFASLSAKKEKTNMDLKLTLSGEAWAQEVMLEIAGETTSQWTPEAFDKEQVVDLTELPAEELQSQLSQAAIKAGLLFLPYINLPRITTDTVD